LRSAPTGRWYRITVRPVGLPRSVVCRAASASQECDPVKLRALGVSAGEVAAAIGAQNVTMPGGRVDTSRDYLSVRIIVRVGSVEALRNIVVREQAGRVVRLTDVASVEDGTGDVETSARWNGEPTVLLTVRKQHVSKPRGGAKDSILALAELDNRVWKGIGPDEYRATMKIGIGAVKGTFEGKVKLSDTEPPSRYTMAVEGSGAPGFVRGTAAVELSDVEGGTRVSYDADIQVGGLVASVGQRLLGGVSKMMLDQFFTKISAELRGDR